MSAGLGWSPGLFPITELMTSDHRSALLVGTHTGAATEEAVWSFLKELKMGLPYDPLIPLLGVHPEKHGALIGKNLCTSMFTVALFTIAKIRKRPMCPSVDEWTTQLWDIYTMGYLLDCKKEGDFTLCDSMDGPGEHYAK